MKKRRWATRILTAPLALLVLLPSLALPALERADVSHETSVTSPHDPASCPQAHDHLLCTQIGGSLAAPAVDVSRATPPDRFGPIEAFHHRAPPATVLRTGPPSRAPPTA